MNALDAALKQHKEDRQVRRQHIIEPFVSGTGAEAK